MSSVFKFNQPKAQAKICWRSVIWTDEEIAKLRTLVNMTSSPIAAKVIGKTRQQVYIKAKQLGLRFRYITHGYTGLGKIWTTEEEIILQNCAGSTSLALAAKRLGRDYQSVKVRASKLGLKFARGAYINTQRSVARLLQVTPKTVRKYAALVVRGKFTRFENEEIEKIAALLLQTTKSNLKVSAKHLRAIAEGNW